MNAYMKPTTEVCKLYIQCSKGFDKISNLLFLVESISHDSYSYDVKRLHSDIRFIESRSNHEDDIALDEATSINLLNRILSNQLKTEDSVQIENPMNLQKAKDSTVSYNYDTIPCYYEDEDYIYY